MTDPRARADTGERQVLGPPGPATQLAGHSSGPPAGPPRRRTAHSQVTVARVGRFQRKSQRCRGCGASWKTHEKKESDISLGVQLVEDAAAVPLFDEALIVSGDSDTALATAAVRRLVLTARVVAVFPPRRGSHALRSTADATVQIFDRLPERHQLPDPVVGPDWISYPRPRHWH